MARLADIQDLLYLVGGTGPDRERLATLAGELGVGKRVRFLGKVEEGKVADYYRACDLTSRAWGSPFWTRLPAADRFSGPAPGESPTPSITAAPVSSSTQGTPMKPRRRCGGS